MTSKEKIQETIEYAVLHGDENTCDAFNINQETLSRYKRTDKRLSYLGEINKKYDDNTLKMIASGIQQNNVERPKISFKGNEFRFALVSCTHFGSKFYDVGYWDSICGYCKENNITTLFHVGDVTEGMSNRPGHIYELEKLGFSDQKKYSKEEFEKFNGEIYMISGNHDRWFKKSNGADMVPDICELNQNWHFLGDDVGEFEINGIKIMLWHGEDGAAYAISYRLQKICESFTGGQKPNVLLAGHDHKSIYLPERNIHCVGAGCIQRQTPWMRGKRLAAHTGWWEIILTIADNEVKRINPIWSQFYK